MQPSRSVTKIVSLKIIGSGCVSYNAKDKTGVSFLLTGSLGIRFRIWNNNGILGASVGRIACAYRLDRARLDLIDTDRDRTGKYQYPTHSLAMLCSPMHA